MRLFLIIFLFTMSNNLFAQSATNSVPQIVTVVELDNSVLGHWFALGISSSFAIGFTILVGSKFTRFLRMSAD